MSRESEADRKCERCEVSLAIRDEEGSRHRDLSPLQFRRRERWKVQFATQGRPLSPRRWRAARRAQDVPAHPAPSSTRAAGHPTARPCAGHARARSAGRRPRRSALPLETGVAGRLAVHRCRPCGEEPCSGEGGAAADHRPTGPCGLCGLLDDSVGVVRHRSRVANEVRCLQVGRPCANDEPMCERGRVPVGHERRGPILVVGAEIPILCLPVFDSPQEALLIEEGSQQCVTERGRRATTDHRTGLWGADRRYGARVIRRKVTRGTGGCGTAEGLPSRLTHSRPR